MKSFPNSKYARFLTNTLFVVLTIGLQRCGVRKVIPPNQHLLISNTVKIEGDKIAGRNTKAQILHRTNKRVLFNRMPIFLWLYAAGTNNKNPELSDSVSWRRKFRQELGEPPVLYQPNLAQISADNIKFYLFNKGYFDATCEHTVKKSTRKARVTYIAKTRKPYLIREVSIHTNDSVTRGIIQQVVLEHPAFRLWWPCNLNALDEVETTLTQRLRDSGFFTVSAANIRYEIDTNQIAKNALVKVYLDPPENQSYHKKFTIGKVKLSIQTAPNYLLNNRPKRITLPGIDLELNQYPLNPKVLTQVIRLDSGDFFSQTNWTETYRRLLDLNLFKSVNISQKINFESAVIQPKIDLQTEPRMNFSAEPQLLYSPQGSSGTNFQTASQRSFGLAGILSFNNRNTFGNAEYFKLSSITSFEAIFKKDDIGDFFTGLQQGVIASLKLPKFSFLNRLDALKSFEQQSTLVTTSFQYEQNPNFIRSSFPANVTLQFAKNNFSWYLTPFEISYNRNIISPDFLPQLPALDQDFVLRVFTDQIITPVKIGFIYADNQTKPGSTSHFLRIGMETSGNWHHYYRQLTETNYQADSAYRLFGVNYFQYTKLEAEYRIKRNIDELNVVAFRFNSGIALPYGNSTLVPYDKRYFIGGSNSLRGWRPRGLGPGNTPLSATSLIDRSGEVLLEANFEYRFTLIRKLLETAIFFDAGNIWNLSPTSTVNPNYGVINSENFIKEIALNTGIGLRFDLSIFLFRLDWGMPLRDPSLPENERWILTEKTRDAGFGSYLLNESSLAIGIGYPF